MQVRVLGGAPPDHGPIEEGPDCGVWPGFGGLGGGLGGPGGRGGLGETKLGCDAAGCLLAQVAVQSVVLEEEEEEERQVVVVAVVLVVVRYASPLVWVLCKYHTHTHTWKQASPTRITLRIHPPERRDC